MKNKKLFQKIVLISLAVAALVAIVAPAIFSQTLPGLKQEKLLNGLKVLMWSDAKADKVMIKIRIHAGAAFDPQGREGVMQLLADNIFPNEASREFFAEDLGGGLEIVTNYDYIQVNASSKPENFLTMLETLSAAVSNPSIDKDTTVKLRNALLTRVAALEADPSYVADRAVAKRLFGTFPYGRSQYGTADSLKKIDFADLIDAKARFLTADNATIAISGNFDRALGFKAIRRYFGGWLKADKRVPSTFRQPDAPLTELLTVGSPKPEVAAIRASFRGAARGGKDFAASQVFGGIFELRLKARVATASAPDLFVRNESYVLPGSITVGLASTQSDIRTSNGKLQPTEMVIKALSDPLTDAEFQSARTAAAADWAKRNAEEFWLDADTYKIASIDADRSVFDKLKLDDVRLFATQMQKSPMVSILVYSPAN